MKVPPKRKGNKEHDIKEHAHRFASMKVPPKRKGNAKVAKAKKKAAPPQ